MVKSPHFRIFSDVCTSIDSKSVTSKPRSEIKIRLLVPWFLQRHWLSPDEASKIKGFWGSDVTTFRLYRAWSLIKSEENKVYLKAYFSFSTSFDMVLTARRDFSVCRSRWYWECGVVLICVHRNILRATHFMMGNSSGRGRLMCSTQRVLSIGHISFPLRCPFSPFKKFFTWCDQWIVLVKYYKKPPSPRNDFTSEMGRL